MLIRFKISFWSWCMQESVLYWKSISSFSYIDVVVFVSKQSLCITDDSSFGMFLNDFMILSFESRLDSMLLMLSGVSLVFVNWCWSLMQFTLIALLYNFCLFGSCCFAYVLILFMFFSLFMRMLSFFYLECTNFTDLFLLTLSVLVYLRLLWFFVSGSLPKGRKFW